MDRTAAEHVPPRDRTGTWFADERGIDRRLKVTWHPERKLFVLSVWHRDTCTATFRLPLGDVPRLLNVLVSALSEALTVAGSRTLGRHGAHRRAGPPGGPGAD